MGKNIISTVLYEGGEGWEQQTADSTPERSTVKQKSLEEEIE